MADELDAVLANLRSKCIQEACEGGPRTLLSVLRNLSSMTRSEHKVLVSLFHASPQQSIGSDHYEHVSATRTSQSRAFNTTDWVNHVDGRETFYASLQTSWNADPGTSMQYLWSSVVVHLQVHEGAIAVAACCQALASVVKMQSVQRHLWKHERVSWPDCREVPCLMSTRLRIIPKWRRISLFTYVAEGHLPTMVISSESATTAAHASGAVDKICVDFDCVEEWDLVALALTEPIFGCLDQCVLVNWMCPKNFFEHVLEVARAPEDFDSFTAAVTHEDQSVNFLVDEDDSAFLRIGIYPGLNTAGRDRYTYYTYLLDVRHCSLACSITDEHDCDPLGFQPRAWANPSIDGTDINLYVTEWLEYMARHTQGPFSSVKLLYVTPVSG